MKRAIMLMVLAGLGILTACSNNPDTESQTEKIAAILSGTQQQTSDITSGLADVKASIEKMTVGYQELYSMSESLNTELAAARQDAQTAHAEASSYIKQYQQQSSELAALQSSLYNMTDERAKFEQRYLQTQSEVARLQSQIDTISDEYNDLVNKIKKVNNRTDPTVDDFTETELATFYRIWDEWYEVEMGE